MKQSTKYLYVLILVITIFLFGSCSIERMAMNKVAGALTAPSGNTVFTGDNDPEFVAQALPFAIKMYESLLASLPSHQGLQVQTGSLYIMYANAFLQTPAELLPEERSEEQEILLARAKNLYLRGRDIIIKGLEIRHPGIMDKIKDKKYKEAFMKVDKKEVPALYWAAMGWLAAFAIDPFDMKLGMTVPGAKAMVEHVAALDPNYDSGAIDDFYVLYYGAMPDYMGGDFEKARAHYTKSLANASFKKSAPHIALATTVCVQEQNIEEYKTLLNKVLEIDVEADANHRLVNTLNRRKAEWLLKHADDFFLSEEPGETPAEPADENTGNSTEPTEPTEESASDASVQ